MSNPSTRANSHHGKPHFASAALTALCISISTAAWADTKSFDLSGFDGVSVAEGIHMQVTSGKTFEVTAESRDVEQLELLKLSVRRGTLKAEMDGFMKRPEGQKVTVHVTMPELTHVEASSGADFDADAMAGSDLELTSSGGASLKINAINAGKVSVTVSGGANIKIADGTCTALTADASGGASLDMKAMECATADVDASGGADLSAYAGSISASASSGAGIRVYGAPKVNKVSSSGGGEIDFR